MIERGSSGGPANVTIGSSVFLAKSWGRTGSAWRTRRRPKTSIVLDVGPRLGRPGNLGAKPARITQVDRAPAIGWHRSGPRSLDLLHIIGRLHRHQLRRGC